MTIKEISLNNALVENVNKYQKVEVEGWYFEKKELCISGWFEQLLRRAQYKRYSKIENR